MSAAASATALMFAPTSFAEIELVGDQPRLEVRLLGGVFAEVPQDARLFRGEAG